MESPRPENAPSCDNNSFAKIKMIKLLPVRNVITLNDISTIWNKNAPLQQRLNQFLKLIGLIISCFMIGILLYNSFTEDSNSESHLGESYHELSPKLYSNIYGGDNSQEIIDITQPFNDNDFMKSRIYRDTNRAPLKMHKIIRRQITNMPKRWERMNPMIRTYSNRHLRNNQIIETVQDKTVGKESSNLNPKQISDTLVSYHIPLPGSAPSVENQIGLDTASGKNIVDSKNSPDKVYPSEITSEAKLSSFPTAETMKTSQQVQISPVIPVVPYPFCIYGTPPVNYQQAEQSKLSPIFQIVPLVANVVSNKVVPEASSNPAVTSSMDISLGQGQGFIPVAHQSSPIQSIQNSNPSQQILISPIIHQNHKIGSPAFEQNIANIGYKQLYCSFLPSIQFPSIPGDYQRSSGPAEEIPKEQIISPYYENNIYRNNYNPYASSNSVTFPETTQRCKENYLECLDKSQCISRAHWCDNKVHCPDASDEIRCTCKDRLSKDRICDGFFDCPRGEDELGCFYCPSDTFSCEDWNRFDTYGKCLKMEQKCDGITQCSNGKDEIDCSVLVVDNIDDNDIFTVGYSSGYLHRNYKGKWYPACTATREWAKESCAGEIGTPMINPQSPIQMTSAPGRPGPHISQYPSGHTEIVGNCNNESIYVICPQIPCGTNVMPENSRSSSLRSEDLLVAAPHINYTKNQFNNDQPVELSNNEENIILEQDKLSINPRIVGGRSSNAKTWPFIITIYKDGFYSCGGAILNENWIITAAHCVENYPRHYYQINAGLLRRFSFSPTHQSRRAELIVIHPQYDAQFKMNDIAMIKLNEPLKFNRWVRPICLPNSESFPLIPGTICTVVGWGRISEYGPEPDHLREVQVPILPSCKQIYDQTESVICAGVLEGGKDACQGDSGGPLMCRMSPNSEVQWYVAGIVSHGIGCARPDEPGVYTNVSYFLPWIYQMSDNLQISSELRPLDKCPGFSCSRPKKCIPMNRVCDKIVNCIDAEDEMNCPLVSPNTHVSNFRNFGESQNKNELLKNETISSKSNPDLETEAIEKYPINEKTGVIEENFVHRKITSPERNPINSATENFSTNSTPITEKPTYYINPTISDSTTIEPLVTTDYSSIEALNVIQQSYFTCTKLMQNIPMTKKCNKIVDCEDGTDEANCTCKEILKNVLPTAICNGRVDCYDQSDETDCSFCQEDEFICFRSETCIPLDKKCDGLSDCPFSEDELDCYALYQSPLIDADKRPDTRLSGKGKVIKYDNGIWTPCCFENLHENNELNAIKICQYLGFNGLNEFIYDTKPDLKELNYLINENNTKFIESVSNSTFKLETEVETDDCVIMNVDCRKILTGQTNFYSYRNASTQKETHIWPWQSAIFVEGKYYCPAIFLNKHWFLTSMRCTDNIDLSNNATTIVSGLSPEFKYVPGPHEITRYVVMIKSIEEFDVSILSVEDFFPMTTRHIQPIFAEKRFWKANSTDECFAIGTDPHFNSIEIPLKPVLDNCSSCDRCFRRKVKDEQCRNKTDGDWSGIVTCRGSNGWYPAAAFREEDIICGFETSQSLNSIDLMYPSLLDAMDNSTVISALPFCNGIRCDRGRCLPWKNVCDSIQDCKRGDDEQIDICETKKRICVNSTSDDCKCSKAEITCRNGNCVPKEKFCDGTKDCPDGSDEPDECNCRAYLELTNPERVCDNIRHCFDKTDEQNCSCIPSSFECINNSKKKCISRDFICDGERDCENNEDEEACQTINNNMKFPSVGGEVLHRSFGIWHSECYSTPVNSTAQANQVCKSLGFSNGTIIPFEDIDPRPASHLKFDNFFMIRFNVQLSISMRQDKPLAQIVETTDNCHRAFVKCL